MNTNPRSEPRTITSKAWDKGQRLHCETCGSEIEIVSPCTCDPPDQVLRCCGQHMRPSVGVSVNVGVE